MWYVLQPDYKHSLVTYTFERSKEVEKYKL